MRTIQQKQKRSFSGASKEGSSAPEGSPAANYFRWCEEQGKLQRVKDTVKKLKNRKEKSLESFKVIGSINYEQSISKKEEAKEREDLYNKRLALVKSILRDSLDLVHDDIALGKIKTGLIAREFSDKEFIELVRSKAKNTHFFRHVHYDSRLNNFRLAVLTQVESTKSKDNIYILSIEGEQFNDTDNVITSTTHGSERLPMYKAHPVLNNKEGVFQIAALTKREIENFDISYYVQNITPTKSRNFGVGVARNLIKSNNKLFVEKIKMARRIEPSLFTTTRDICEFRGYRALVLRVTGSMESIEKIISEYKIKKYVSHISQISKSDFIITVNINPISDPRAEREKIRVLDALDKKWKSKYSTLDTSKATFVSDFAAYQNRSSSNYIKEVLNPQVIDESAFCKYRKLKEVLTGIFGKKSKVCDPFESVPLPGFKYKKDKNTKSFIVRTVYSCENKSRTDIYTLWSHLKDFVNGELVITEEDRVKYLGDTNKFEKNSENSAETFLPLTSLERLHCLNENQMKSLIQNIEVEPEYESTGKTIKAFLLPEELEHKRKPFHHAWYANFKTLEDVLKLTGKTKEFKFLNFGNTLDNRLKEFFTFTNGIIEAMLREPGIKVNREIVKSIFSLVVQGRSYKGRDEKYLVKKFMREFSRDHRKNTILYNLTASIESKAVSRNKVAITKIIRWELHKECKALGYSANELEQCDRFFNLIASSGLYQANDGLNYTSYKKKLEIKSKYTPYELLKGHLENTITPNQKKELESGLHLNASRNCRELDATVRGTDYRALMEKLQEDGLIVVDDSYRVSTQDSMGYNKCITLKIPAHRTKIILNKLSKKYSALRLKYILKDSLHFHFFNRFSLFTLRHLVITEINNLLPATALAPPAPA